MPRKPRSARHAPDACYHVLNRGHARETVFHDPDDFAAFLHLLDRYAEAAPFRLYQYCLMSNHFHLLVHFDRPDRLSPVMAGLLVASWL
jgi:REP element-mobilizing transposase RayT